MSNEIKVDPILVAVIGNRLEAITKEMGETMLRTSRSPIFSEAQDFVTAIFDRNGRLVAQTAYIPILMVGLHFAIKSMSDYFKGDINEGDVYVLNDPFKGNTHPPDVNIARPIFYNGELQFWAITKGHQADIGGGGVCGYNPNSTTIYEECLCIPPSRLYRKGEYQKDVWNLIMSNIFLRDLVEGDFSCQVGACTIADRNLQSLMQKYGIDVIYQAIEEIFDASERQLRTKIGELADGKYYAERFMDHDGVNKDKLIKVAADVEVKGEEVIIDLSKSDPQVAGYVNSSIANTHSACYLALIIVVEPHVRFNEGAMRPVKIIAPEGSVVNARHPAPTTCCTITTGSVLMEIIWLALAPASPHTVQAGWARWCNPATMGFNPRTGRSFADIHWLGKGGGGATEGYDGWDHIGVVVNVGGSRAPDPEIHQMVDPYFVLDYELWCDSAGAGKWRGGLGVIYRWRIDAPNIPCAVFGSGNRDETVAFGLEGGKPGIKHKLRIVKANGEIIPIDSESLYHLSTGDIVEQYSSGGGGFGNPYERSEELVLLDVRNGVVSVGKAKEDYGVVINPVTMEIDRELTDSIRG